MASLIVVDDTQRTATTAGQPVLTYTPADAWVSNRICIGCDVRADEALSRLAVTAERSTWTNAWWSPEVRVSTVSLEFEGPFIAAYFILFFRSLDFEAQGPSDIRFFVDDNLESRIPINPTDYTFQDDFTERLPLFERTNLTSNQPHQLRIQYTHSGTRPQVAVALDSIEYQAPQPVIESVITEPPPGPNRIAMIVGPIVTGVLLIINVIFIVWCCRRRKRKQRIRRILDDPASRAETADMRLAFPGASDMASRDPTINPYIVGNAPSVSAFSTNTVSSAPGLYRESQPPPYADASGSNESAEMPKRPRPTRTRTEKAQIPRI